MDIISRPELEFALILKRDNSNVFYYKKIYSNAVVTDEILSPRLWHLMFIRIKMLK